MARESEERKKRKKRDDPKIKSSTLSDADSDDNRKRKERSRERKDKKHRRSNKDRKKKRHRDYDTASSDEEERVSVKEKRHKHKHKHNHKRKKTEDRRDQNNDFKGAVDEVKALSEEDYFSKNKEFSTWLREEQGLFFSNLSSEKARMLFVEFVSAWNSGGLRSKYYEGMSSAPRTDHNWGFKVEKKMPCEDPIDLIEEREAAKRIEKSERKKFHKMQEVVVDELLPKATGRERMLEKRVINREQARAREESPEILKEKDIMGGGDDFQIRLEKQRMRRQKKEMERSSVLEEKLQASRQKEAAAMSQLQAIINDAGGKITIPKRD